MWPNPQAAVWPARASQGCYRQDVVAGDSSPRCVLYTEGGSNNNLFAVPTDYARRMARGRVDETCQDGVVRVAAQALEPEAAVASRQSGSQIA